MAMDMRAIENIASAPASRSERSFATWTAIGALIALLLTLPFRGRQFGESTAFLPMILGSTILALALAAGICIVQYRVSRTPQLAFLAIAHGGQCLFIAMYALTLPHIFSPDGVFGNGAYSSAWFKASGHTVFVLAALAYVLVDLGMWRLTSRGLQLLVLGALALVAGDFVAIFREYFPPLVNGAVFLPLWRSVLAPFEAAGFAALAIALGLRGAATVGSVWLRTVCIVSCLDLLSVGPLLSARYSVGWYLGRFEDLVAGSLLLAVFFFKVNELLVRVAFRNKVLAERTIVAETELAQGEERYRFLANIVPQLIWTANGSGAIEYVNDRWINYTGYDLAATQEYGWRVALDADEPTALDDRWHRSLRHGEPFNAEYRLREGETGKFRWFLVTALPLRNPAGAVIRWIGSCTDIDRSKQIEEREAFLARSGERLAASLDLAATLATLEQLAIPRLCDWMRVDLLDDDGFLRTESAASTDPAETLALQALLHTRVSGASGAFLLRVVARRESVIATDASFLAEGIARGRSGTTIAVPLSSGERPIGTLTLVRASATPPEGDDVRLARDFARRAAQALDHARLYERERTTADALQRAMLPQHLPAFSEVRFSASYSAASESQRVGGDFYDAFVLPDGCVALTIGDVTGHGLEAAVIMGEIRQALRAASFERADPASILDRASRLLIASGRSLFVTAIFGILDRATGVFRYATAGHPAPLVFDGATLVRLQTSGLPLGLRDDDGVDFTIVLPEHATIVLYTDGLLEFARDLDEGDRRIEAAVRELVPRGDAQLADAIMERVLGNDASSDDIAILTATMGDLAKPAPVDYRAWRFRSRDARTATLVRHVIGELASGWTGRSDLTFEAELAFGELFSNVVRHAPGSVDVTLTNEDDSVVLTVRDEGTGFDADRVSARDMLAENGRGLDLVRALCLRVHVRRVESGGTEVSVAFGKDATTARVISIA